MKKNIFVGFLIFNVLLTTACKMKHETKNYHLKSTAKIIVTSEAGDKLAVKENVPFKEGQPSGHVVQINPEILKQKIDGIGSSFTEASAFVLAHLDEAQDRKSVV